MATEDLPIPKSRKETYLGKAAGMDVEELPTPASREEQYLNAIAENGGGGGGGTSNFNKLTNRPKYNGVTMTGDTNIPEVKTYTAGTNITISDQNVISATDGNITLLTSEDATGHSEEFGDYVPVWLLEPGTYKYDHDSEFFLATHLTADENDPTAEPEPTSDAFSGVDAIVMVESQAEEEGNYGSFVIYTGIADGFSGGGTVAYNGEGEFNTFAYNEFTGTNGSQDGTSGLVPAPATTDAGKFLKADGTWDTAGGGSDTQIQLLTDDDANYTLDGDDYIAAWLLDGGTYKLDKDATVPLLINVEETSPNTYEPLSSFEADEQPLVLIERSAPDDPYNPVVIMVLYSQGCALCAADKTTGVEAASPVDAFGRFTGTDGTYNGVDGLVPAPQTTDANKFLKSDGTWATVGGGATGAVVELTTADYDYTWGATEGVALWRLDAGLYHTANNVQAFAGSDGDFMLSLKSHLIIIDDSSNQKLIKVVGDDFSTASNGVYKGFVEYKVAASDGAGSVAQSESVVSTASLLRRGASAPTSSDVGFRGQLWYDTTNNKLYVNVNRPSDYSGNWKEITLS